MQECLKAQPKMFNSDGIRELVGRSSFEKTGSLCGRVRYVYLLCGQCVRLR